MKKIYTFILMLGLAQQPVFSQYGGFTFDFGFNFDLSNMDLSNTDLNFNINLGNNYNFGDFDFSDLYPRGTCPYCPDETIGNFSFTTSSSFDTAIANEALWERARKAAKRDWFNKQKELIKKNIEEKLNTSFPNYDAAKNALFLHSEQGNIHRNSAAPKNRYDNLKSRGYSATRGYLKHLKLIQHRRAEINAGNMNNPQYGYLTIDGTPLKDIRDLTTLNQKWSNIAFPIGANISNTHRYKYIHQKLNNLGAGFDREIIAQKNSFYAGFNEWDQLNYMQFLINFEEIKRLTAPPLYMTELGQLFYKFRGTDKATTPVIETYAINHRGGGLSVFDPQYPIRYRFRYLNNICGGIINYAAWERDKQAALNNLLNNTSTADFAINNLIAELNITETNQKSWLFAHRSEASLIDAFLDENRVNGVATAEAKGFSTAAVGFLKDNTQYNFTQYENWFSQFGAELETNPTVVNPNDIIFETPLIQQSLPTFTTFITNFPKRGNSGNYSAMSTTDAYTLAGGSLLNSHINQRDQYNNACAIRASRGLLYSGIQIPVLKYNGSQRTQKGGDRKNYILDAVSFNTYMIAKFGETSVKLEGADANDPVKVAALLNGKNGIYVIVNSNTRTAGYSGHCDLIINGKNISGAYTTPRGGVKSIRVWELN